MRATADGPHLSKEATASGDAPSKSELKRRMHALQALGERLAELSADQLARIQLPDELREAVQFFSRIKGHEAKRRHRQFIGKLMRRVDADAIRVEVEAVTGESRAAVTLVHRAEAWRDRLLADDDALTAFIDEHRTADAQWLHAAIRSARRERELQQAPKHARELYRSIHRTLEDERRESATPDNGERKGAGGA